MAELEETLDRLQRAPDATEAPALHVDTAAPPVVIDLDAARILGTALAADQPLAGAAVLTTARSAIATPSGGPLDGAFVNLDPWAWDALAAGLAGGLAFPRVDATPPVAPPQLPADGGLACAPACGCPPGTCGPGETCACRSRARRGGPLHPDGAQPTPGPDGQPTVDERPGAGAGAGSGDGKGGAQGGNAQGGRPGEGGGGGPGAFARGLGAGGDEPAPAPWGGPGSANVGAGRAAGPVVTVTEANLRAERPRPLPPAEQERADRLWWMNDLLDAHTLPEAYRTRSGGYRALHDASAFNEDLARLAAQREAERLDRARRVRDAERRYVAWLLAVLRALEARAAADGGARYAATIAYLGARVTEVSAQYRTDARLTEALEREHGAAGSHALAQAEAFAAERAARAPVVRRDAAYAAYGGMELLGRGLVDAAVGMFELDGYIAPLLPDRTAQRGGYLAGFVLAPLRSGVRGAAAIGTVGLDTVRALARAPRVGHAARAAAEGARDWRRAEAARTARLGGGPAGVGGRAALGGRLAATAESAGRLRSAGGRLPRVPNYPFKYVEDLGPDVLGKTNLRTGNVRILRSLQSDPLLEAQVLRHEWIHRVLTPTGQGPVSSLLRETRILLKQRSAFFHGLEEGVAQGYGTGRWGRGIVEGVRYGVRVGPEHAGIVDVGLLAAATAATWYALRD